MDIKLKVVQEVEACFVKAESHFECTLIRPKVEFDIRGQDAGRAYFPITNRAFQKFRYKKPQTQIKFNEKLLEKNPQTFLDSIVAHECAHLIAYELFGAKVKPHGEEWKSIMQGLFEVDASVQHNLDVSEVVNKPYIYNCSCMGEGIALSNRQHKSAQRGSIYLCKKCKSKLKFKCEKDSNKNTILSPSSEIKGLYIHLPNQFHLSSGLILRWNKILNKKRPSFIYSSHDLTKSDEFLNWLRSSNFRRKYQGSLNSLEVQALIADKSISHCLLIKNNEQQLENIDWNILVNNGLVLRTVKV
jgi:SprT protein